MVEIVSGQGYLAELDSEHTEARRDSRLWKEVVR
jgi:hypothetical protein